MITLKKPLIIHVIESLRIGGAEVLLADTIPMLSSRYRQIVVTLYPSQSRLVDQVAPYLEQFICLNMTSKWRLPLAIYQLRKFIHREQPILIHTHLLWAALCSKMACPPSTPLFYTLHNIYSQDAFTSTCKGRLLPWIEYFTTCRHHHLLAVSQTVLDDYCGYVSGFGSSQVLYNFVHPHFFQQSYQPTWKPQDQRPFKVVSVGTLKKQKNYPYLLDIFSLLKNEHVSLDIWGEGPLRSELEQKILKYNLTNVRLCGHCDQISSTLTNYDLYLTTSSYEGYGLAPLEAMAVGLPVIASDIPVHREVLDSAAFYCNLAQPNTAAQFIKQYLGHDLNFIKERSHLARMRAEQIATVDTYFQRLLSCYDRVTT